MDDILRELIKTAKYLHATDIHMYMKHERVIVNYRTSSGLLESETTYDVSLLNYLRFLASLDLSNAKKMQSGHIEYHLEDEVVPMRFSYLHSSTIITAVLRIMNVKESIPIDELCINEKQIEILKKLARKNEGLILFSGPTGSGKSTTMYSILNYIASFHKNIITLEDPIEIYYDSLIQIEIEKSHITYEEGLKQILRHDPDVIMIGEIRDEESAKLAVRAALTGHLVISTIHASSTSGVINRLIELGVQRMDLEQVLLLISHQYLLNGKKKQKKKVCIYEFMQEQQIQNELQGIKNRGSLVEEIEYALKSGYITITEANKYI